MHVLEREVNGYRYRIAAQSVWDSARGRSVARQGVLGPGAPPPGGGAGAPRTVGGGAPEQLDWGGQTDRACGNLGAKNGPSVGELVVAVAIQRACSPGAKRSLADFLDASVARGSCLPGGAVSGPGCPP